MLIGLLRGVFGDEGDGGVSEHCNEENSDDEDGYGIEEEQNFLVVWEDKEIADVEQSSSAVGGCSDNFVGLSSLFFHHLGDEDISEVEGDDGTYHD
jgi:hypothetical protein